MKYECAFRSNVTLMWNGYRLLDTPWLDIEEMYIYVHVWAFLYIIIAFRGSVWLVMCCTPCEGEWVLRCVAAPNCCWCCCCNLKWTFVLPVARVDIN